MLNFFIITHKTRKGLYFMLLNYHQGNFLTSLFKRFILSKNFGLHQVYNQFVLGLQHLTLGLFQVYRRRGNSSVIYRPNLCVSLFDEVSSRDSQRAAGLASRPRIGQVASIQSIQLNRLNYYAQSDARDLEPVHVSVAGARAG